MLVKSSIIILIHILFTLVLAQNNERQLFDQGLDLYKKQDFYSAQNTFLLLLKNYPQTKLLTSAKLMLAKSYFALSDYKSAEIVCEHFENQHKNSNYLDDIVFLRGNIIFMENRYMEAVEEWLKVIYNQSDPRLKKKAGNYVFHTMNVYCSDKDLRELKRKYDQEPLIGLVEIIQASKLIRSGKNKEGMVQLNNFLLESPHHLYSDIARDLIEGKVATEQPSNTFLVLKSGHEDIKLVSEAISAGIHYAAYEMNTRFPEKKIIIDSLTFYGNLLETVQGTFTVLKQPPLAMISALDNDETTALSLISKYEDIPLVATLSSENGLANISSNIFQINPDAEIKGKVLAKYAIEKLGAKTFAILAPTDAYGQSIANSFEKTVLDHRGEIAEKLWYYQDTQDFSKQFKAIRKKGFYLAYRDSVLKEYPDRSEDIIKSQFREYRNNTLFSNENVRGSIDSTQIASEGIDAIFIALYPEDIAFIAPQFAFYNIKTNLLGNSGWNDRKTLELNRPYLEGITFLTSGYFDPESWNYREFLSRFRKKMQITPTFYHLLGYDVGKWMMTNYQPGDSRQTFINNLTNSDKYQGIMSNIHFTEKARVNSELNIIKYYLGQFIKIQ